MARVRIGSVSSHWDKLAPKEKGIIFNAASARVKGCFFSPQFKARAWDGFKRFFEPATGRLPSGLVPDAIEALQAAGYEVEIVEPEVRPFGPRPGAVLNFELDPEHQGRAFDAMTKSRRGILKAATNSGKTKIAEAWCAANDCKVAYLVPTIELLNQTVESFRADTNLHVGQVRSGIEWEIGRDVTVILATSVAPKKSGKTRKLINEDAVVRFTEIAKQFEAVIVDECQYLNGETWRKVMRLFVNAHHRYGLSGSPWEPGDDAMALTVKSSLGPIIAEVSNHELIQKGWSAKPIVRMVPVRSGRIETPEFAADEEVNASMIYGPVYEEGIVFNTLRNNYIVSLAERFVAEDKPLLIICHRIPQCELIEALLKTAGVSCRVINGLTPSDERESDLADFKKGRYPVLVSNVMGVGVDLPTLRALIFAAGGKSTKASLQRIGRGIRRKLEGKNEVEIYDFIDEGHKYILEHTLQRAKLYESEGFEVKEEEIRL